MEELDISKSAAGVLAAAYPAGTFLGALPGGWLAARAGVRSTTLIGPSIMAVSSVAFAFGTSVAVLDVPLRAGRRRRADLGRSARAG